MTENLLIVPLHVMRAGILVGWAYWMAVHETARALGLYRTT